MRPIDADELADMLSQVRQKVDPKNYKTATEFHTRDLMLLNLEQMVRISPTIDAVKHGRWIEDDDGDGRHCSVCGVDYCDLVTYPENFNFCPMCGAKMDAGNTEAAT